MSESVTQASMGSECIVVNSCVISDFGKSEKDGN